MYEVFIDNKVIIFTETWKKKTINSTYVLFKNVDLSTVNLLKWREEISSETVLIVLTPDPEVTIRTVFADYQFIQAAGGIVKRKDKYLFIKRLGLWDLPKGKMEKKEKPAETAVREIEEECGLETPGIVQFLGVTYHTYTHRNRKVLKKNWWYELRYSGPKTLTPQQEEGITKAAWLSKKEWGKVRKNTYASIEAVLKWVK